MNGMNQIKPYHVVFIAIKMKQYMFTCVARFPKYGTISFISKHMHVLANTKLYK